MKTFTLTAAGVAAAALAGGPALAPAEPKANCQPSASARGNAAGPKAPEKIDGQVVKVDAAKGMITVRNKDGSMHEFKGYGEALKKYKPADNSELPRRPDPC